MRNNGGKSEHSCLVPDLRGNSFSFSPVRMIFAVGLSYTWADYIYIYMAKIYAKYMYILHTYICQNIGRF